MERYLKYLFRITPLLLLLLAILILPACRPAGKDEGRKTLPSVIAKIAPKEPTTYRFPINTDPKSLDPAHITDTVSDCIARRIFSGLVSFDANLEIQPGVAESFEFSPDARVWRFKIRKGVKFQNGRVVTPEDVLYTFKRVLAKETASERIWTLDRIAGAKAFMEGRNNDLAGLKIEGRDTVVVTLEKPFAPFIYFLAMSNTFIVPKEEVEKWGKEFSHHPVGAGPYRFVKWQTGDYVRLEAFEEYFKGKPKVTNLLFRIVPDPITRFEEFKNGNLEHVDVPVGRLEEVRSDPKLASLLVSKPTLDIYNYGFHMQKAPFKGNPDLRLAINYAIDKEFIVKNILQGKMDVSRSYLPPGLWGHDPKRDGYSYNPQLARDYLKKAGYPDGKGLPKLTLYHSNNEQFYALIAQQAQSDLTKIGIAVELHQMEWATYLQAVDDGEPAFFQVTWLADYPDPDNFLFVLLNTKQWGPPGNSTRYSNPDFDKLVEKAQTISDRGERIKLYQKAEDIALKESPWVLLFTNNVNTLVQPYVKNLTVTGMDRSPQLSNADMAFVEYEY